jgi:hypothetical protein
MTATQQLWFASLVGAAVFFAAGAIVARARSARAGAARQPGAGALPGATPGAQQAEAALGQLQHGEREAREAARQAREEAATLRRQLDEAHQASRSPAVRDDGNAAELARAAQTARAELATVQRQLASAEAARVAAEATASAAEAARKSAESALRRADAAGSSMSPEAQERMREADRVLAERSGQLREAMSQVEWLKSKVNDAEALRAEHTRMRTQVHEMEFLTKEVERLREALKSAKSIALGGTRQPPRAANPDGPVTTGSITEALAGAIDRFQGPQMRSIAIADAVGFPVSSQGDDGLELAAYAALLNDVASRANQFLPVATPASIEMIDEHGARISVWPFDVGGDRLLLVNLAVGATDAARVEGMLSDVTAILAPSAPQSQGSSAS